MNHESQCKRMIKEMKKRKVKNHEFMGMYIMSHTKRLSDIRQMGFNVQKERVYDSNGKATGTFQYWIPRQRKPKTTGLPVENGMKYELQDSKPDWLGEKLSTLRAKVIHR